MKLSQEFVQGVCDRYYIENAVSELMGMLEHVYAVEPLQSIVEIGVCFGGSLKIWEKVAPVGGVVIGVDHYPDMLKRLTGEIVAKDKPLDWEIEWTEGNVSKLRSDRDVYMVIGESCDPDTADTVERLLGGKKIDFWFHDGFHYGPIPVYDYHNFKHLIRADGLVCVADINNMKRGEWVDNCGCQVLARELPEPKTHPLRGHRQGMCMWRKQEWPEFDPAALVKKYNLDTPGYNVSGGVDPAIYDYPERN